MKIHILLFLSLVGCDTSSDTGNKMDKKEWHIANYPPAQTEPVSLPRVELKKIREIQIGDHLSRIEEIAGYQAIHIYYDVDYAVLIVSEEGRIWEVAFKYTPERTIADISYIERTDQIDDPFKD